MYFNFFWEFYHPVRVFYWFHSIQNGIKVFGNQWFTALPTWIFFLCGQLVLIYFKNIKKRLGYLMMRNSMKISDRKIIVRDILKTLRCIKRLNLAIDLLHRRFSTMLLATCFITGITLLSSSYFMIDSIGNPSKLWLVCWELTDVIDSLIRFFLLGYISDRMRKAVFNDVHQTINERTNQIEWKWLCRFPIAYQFFEKFVTSLLKVKLHSTCITE